MNLNFVKDVIEDGRNDSMSCGKLIFIILLTFVTFFGICCLAWWIEWPLWEVIMVKVFGLPALTFWQMAGFDILLSLRTPHFSGSSKSKD